MSSTQASAANNRARPSACRHLAVCLSFMALAPAAGAAPGKTYFFATPEACAVSGAFSPRECAAAFANARLQLRDRAPRFATAAECRLKFRLCEISRAETREDDAMAYAPADAPAFTPLALGVEMIASPRGAEAAPTLAIDTRARLFSYYPVSRPYEARRVETAPFETARETPGILSADRFEPFSKRKPSGSVTTFTASALGAIEGATHDQASAETPEQRRNRLKSAPFVE